MGKKKTNKTDKNKETNRISYAFMLVFGIMIVYIVVFNAFLAKNILNNPYNICHIRK